MKSTYKQRKSRSIYHKRLAWIKAKKRMPKFINARDAYIAAINETENARVMDGLISYIKPSEIYPPQISGVTNTSWDPGNLGWIYRAIDKFNKWFRW